NIIALKLAIRDINKHGGVLGQPLKLEIGDYKSMPSLGSTVALGLISKGAKVIFTSADFDFGSPAALAANSKHIPAISLGAGAPAFGKQGIGPYAFTMGTYTGKEAAAWAERMYAKGFRHPYLLNDTTIAYDTTWCSYFKQRWSQLAGSKSITGEDTFKNS